MSLLVGIIFAILAISANFRGVTPQPPLTPQDGTLCTKTGMNPVEGSPSEFVVCAKDKGRFKGAVSECPDGEVFDRYTSSCIKDISIYHRVRRQNKPKPADEKPCNATLSCYDCHTLRVCASLGSGKYMFLSDVNCTDSTAYCNTDKKACSDVPSPNCGSQYECTGEGYFPDATDCTKFHYCYKTLNDTLMSQDLPCESNQVYSTAKKMCVNKVRPTDCHVASCPVNKTLVAAFPGEPSFFVICMTGVPKYVFYCGPNKEFSNTSKTCEMVCKEAGRLPDSENCHKYYQCTQNPNGIGFTAVQKDCPTGTRFDSNIAMCVAGDCT